MVELPQDLRLGVVDFANVAPLVAGLPRAAQWRGVPSAVADRLATGEVDAAIVPAIELGRMPGLVAMASPGIAADGRCESVLLHARVPLERVRSLRLDPASRTSAALARILLEREGAKDVELHREPGPGEGVAGRLDGVDACLVIGDPALVETPPEDVSTFDLAAEWKRHVGLPFVFAVWASGAGRTLDASARAAIAGSLEEGLKRLPELAREEAERTGLEASRLLTYFQTLQYRLSAEHLRGLRAFLDEAYRVGILTERPEPRFHDEVP